MKSIMKSLAVAVAVMALGVGTALAQSAKATAQVKNLVEIDVAAAEGVDLTDPVDIGALPWETILTQEIKMASWKDLFIHVSIECGLYTRTKVTSSGGTTDTATADAGVRVRVKITGPDGSVFYALPHNGGNLAITFDEDGVPVVPSSLDGITAPNSGVSFCRRIQQLTAKFAGIVECDELLGCVLTDEELELVQATLDANAFGFVTADLKSGVHTIEVQAVGIAGGLPAADPDSAANAFAGAGSVTIEAVRMIKNENWDQTTSF